MLSRGLKSWLPVESARWSAATVELLQLGKGGGLFSASGLCVRTRQGCHRAPVTAPFLGGVPTARPNLGLLRSECKDQAGRIPKIILVVGRSAQGIGAIEGTGVGQGSVPGVEVVELPQTQRDAFDEFIVHPSA